MAITNVLDTDSFDTWRTKTNTIATNLGDTATLTTVATNAAAAVDEINGHIGTVANLIVVEPDLVTTLNETRRRVYAHSLALG